VGPAVRAEVRRARERACRDVAAQRRAGGGGAEGPMRDVADMQASAAAGGRGPALAAAPATASEAVPRAAGGASLNMGQLQHLVQALSRHASVSREAVPAALPAAAWPSVLHDSIDVVWEGGAAGAGKGGGESGSW